MPAKQTTTKTAPAATSTTAPAPVPAPKKEKAPKTAAPQVEAAVVVVATKPAAVKKAKAPKAVVAAAAATPAVAVVAAETSSTEEVASASTLTADFSDLIQKIQQISTGLSSLKTELRSLEKKSTRELKSAVKASQKRKRKNNKSGNRQPSGFVKPTLISDELASFLGKTKGTEMARTEVTREINAYIRANQLQDKVNGRRINADSKLSSLLKLNSGEELTYFNLQRYMSPHFAKSSGVAAAVSV